MPDQARVRLHLPSHMVGDDPEKVPAFFRRLLAGLEGLGARTQILARFHCGWWTIIKASAASLPAASRAWMI